MKFAEKLPDACPPSDAVDTELLGVFRLTDRPDCSEEHFKSHAALGKPLPRSLGDICRWSSCSLTTDPHVLKKLKKMKHRFAVKLNIPIGSGVSKSGGIHIDFWRLATFDPTVAVVGLEEFNG